MEVVGSRDICEKRPRKRKLSFHTYARRGCERKRERERERERERKKRKKKWEDKLKGRGGEGVKLTRGGERAEERRENERMRELRVFRQLGKPSRDRSREDFFSGNTLSFPHLSLLSFLSRTLVSFLYFSPAPHSLNSVCFTTSWDQIFRV